jgi:hypothetical protein
MGMGMRMGIISEEGKGGRKERRGGGAEGIELGLTQAKEGRDSRRLL